ncbi:hypothetical protein PHISCL_05576 [Aspergillus sclerotialis]|uniref:Fe2OG dioxygenase domain-containing protein n=1 Tax=Aspergillus sclerotialis TaxID=2070753 RepID=A0A3A2ZHS8_9EURO|nr:hypothetical protein PHISCL_05576 [Aspergillus sclerotialis]
MPSRTFVSDANIKKSLPPPKVIGPTTTKATRPTNKIPQDIIDGAKVVKKEEFDPERHLQFQPPTYIYTMKEFGFEGQGISPVAASEPFPLFTPEAIKQIRAEIFSEPVLRDCQYSSSFAKNMIRGMGRARAPFTHDAWSSPEVAAMVSSVAGIDLTHMFDYEIANINISINDQTTVISSDGKVQSKDSTSAFAWHYDSFPFVCVTMVSDCSEMIGGETAIRTPSGEVRKIRGPAMVRDHSLHLAGPHVKPTLIHEQGTAVVMQGRYLEHKALKSIGGRERISMVTPFRPKSPLIRDESILTGSRAISNWSELYHGYTDYRLEVLEERLREKRKSERIREDTKRPFDCESMRRFLEDQIAYLETTYSEIYPVEDMDED